MRTGLSGVSPVFGVLLFVLLLLSLSGAASASCCSNWAVGSNCCNVFSCNCDGPCTNFGCSCPPVSVGGACGNCPGYDTCTPPSGGCAYCTSPLTCCNNGTQCCSTQTKAPAVNLSPVVTAQRTFTLPAATPRERFKEIDKDGNGVISLAEASEWLKKNVGGMSASELQSAFKALDKNKSGTIEPAEFDSELAKGTGKPPK